MVRKLVGLVVIAAVLAAAPAAVAQTIPDRYIVVLKDSVDDPDAVASEHGRQYGVTKSHTYRHALKGYAATIPQAAFDRVKADPRVLSVSLDRHDLRLAAQPATPCSDLNACQALGNAVNRIDGDLSSTNSGDGAGTVPVNVAVLDSGIDVDHPDLNVVGGKNCSDGRGARTFDDPDGHGTLVGGFIGALDNGIGRVGVAPGARLWAVDVTTGDDGHVTDASVVCGLDFATASRRDADPTNDIAVVNMSLRGNAHGTDTSESCLTATVPGHRAVCGAVAAGIVPVAAAGNEGDLGVQIESQYPAGYDQVLTVTAMTDLDGKPGGESPIGPAGSCSRSFVDDGFELADDTAAFFSGSATLPEDQAHTVAAPGVCINSTWIDGQYATSTGTSFATPLAAGTVALCIHSGPCKGLTPAQIITKIVADARAYNGSRKGRNYGFQGDPLRPIPGKYYGDLIRAGLY